MTKVRWQKIRELAKGNFGRSKNCKRIAANKVHKSLEREFIKRKLKHREYRQLWISNINGSLSEYDYRYSHFISHLDSANIKLNRNMMANLAMTEPFSFKALADVTRFLDAKRRVEESKNRIPESETDIENHATEAVE